MRSFIGIKMSIKLSFSHNLTKRQHLEQMINKKKRINLKYIIWLSFLNPITRIYFTAKTSRRCNLIYKTSKSIELTQRLLTRRSKLRKRLFLWHKNERSREKGKKAKWAGNAILVVSFGTRNKSGCYNIAKQLQPSVFRFVCFYLDGV